MARLRKLVSSLNMAERIALASFVSTVIMGLAQFFFGTFDALWDIVARPDMRYVTVASGIGSDPYPIPLRSRTCLKDCSEARPVALTGLIIANQSSKPLNTPLVVSVEQLSQPILELALESHTFPLDIVLRQCEAEELPFRPEDQTGESDLCFRITKFPAGGVVSVLIISAHSQGPLFRQEKLFIGTEENPSGARRVHINRLFSERRFPPFTVILLLIIGMLVFVYVGRRWLSAS